MPKQNPTGRPATRGGSSQRSLARRTLLAGCLASASALAAGCGDARGANRAPSSAEEPSGGSTFAFDTYCTFSVYGDDAAPALLATTCGLFDRLFNAHAEDSDIARINAAAGEPVVVNAYTADLIERALAFCRESDGLFDITIGAASLLWDFETGIRPDAAQVASALEHVDWRGVEVDRDASTVRLSDPQARLDLGGIAKGYAADRLCELLRDATTATGAVISLGGNIALYGTKPDGGSWDVGIRDPNDPGGSATIGTAHMGAGSLVTSGLYERTFELDGTTYWHILDPRTGMPVATDVVSATVCTPSSTVADALSTTLFVAGSRRGCAIADAQAETAAYFVLDGDARAESSRWAELTDFEVS